jgi:hypothetical protein
MYKSNPLNELSNALLNDIQQKGLDEADCFVMLMPYYEWIQG